MKRFEYASYEVTLSAALQYLTSKHSTLSSSEREAGIINLCKALNEQFIHADPDRYCYKIKYQGARPNIPLCKMRLTELYTPNLWKSVGIEINPNRRGIPFILRLPDGGIYTEHTRKKVKPIVYPDPEDEEKYRFYRQQAKV